MSRKLHKFQTVAEYQAYSASTDYTTPCVAVVEENNVIYYDYGNNMPQVDMSDYKLETEKTSVGGNKFGKDAITKINYIPSSITSLDSAFNNFSSLVTAPAIPNSVTDMNMAFNGCSSLVTSPEIPNSVTNLYSTFGNCTKLVNVKDIPNSVTKIPETFINCSSLVTAPAIPNSITRMYYTFRNCSKLKTLTLLPTTPPTYSSALQGCSKLESIYVPDSALEDYRTATGWSEFASKFKPLSSKPSE